MANAWPQTFVYFDLETTGLLSAKDPPKMTQLCFLVDVPGEEIKRLNLYFDPEKPVSAKASELTGLTNTNLKGCPTFSAQAPKIIGFLNNLPKPICLVAHNGYIFDFPILARQLRETGWGEKDVKGIVCCDTLPVFRNLIPEIKSHTLKSVYLHVCCKEPTSLHNAEGDSKMLMEIVNKMKPWPLDEWKPLNDFM